MAEKNSHLINKFMNIDEEIKIFFNQLSSDKRFRRDIHYKSLRNFLIYLNKEVKEEQNTNFLTISTLKNKERLYDYLIIIKDKKEVTKQESDLFFKKYIFKVGIFMSNKHGFAYCSIISIFLKLLIISFIAILADYFLLKHMDLFLPITPVILATYAVRFAYKIYKKKFYGFKL